VEENYINKSIKAITVYYGDLVCNADEAQYEPPPYQTAEPLHWAEQGALSEEAAGVAPEWEGQEAGNAPTPSIFDQEGVVDGAAIATAEDGEGLGPLPSPPPPNLLPCASPDGVTTSFN
jgi:hypothetical protein